MSNEQNNFEGFNQKSEGPKYLYFRIFDDSICMTSKKEVEGWEGPIATQNPKTKAPVETWVNRFDSLIVRVVDANKELVEFPDGTKITNFEFTLRANAQTAYLQLKWIEPVLKRFLKVAPNVDWEQPLYISVFRVMDDGKKKVAVSFRQSSGPDDARTPDKWDKVNEYYNTVYLKDNLENPDLSLRMPSPEQDEFTQKWNYDKQNAFLGRMFVANSLPKIKVIAERLGIKPKAEREHKVSPMAADVGIGNPENAGNLQAAREQFAQGQQQPPVQLTIPAPPPTGPPADDDIPF